MSAPADRDASHAAILLAHTVSLRGEGWGVLGERVRWVGEREILVVYSYAVSAPADQDASQLYYSCRIIRGAGGGGGGGGVLGNG